MGLIRKCDKCKKWYRIDENSLPYNVCVHDEDSNMSWLLCSDCIKSLINWMKGIKNERI